MESLPDIDDAISRLVAERDAIKTRNRKIAARLKVLRVMKQRMASNFDALADAQERMEADLLADYLASDLD